MNVSLTPELERLIEDKVNSGRYQSASEVVREGLRLLDDQDRLRELRLDTVRQQIKVGLDQLDRGEGIPGEDVLKRLRKKSAAARRQSR
jgi:antitoxin ParD1/3/4